MTQNTQKPHSAASLELDLREKGALKDGAPQVADTRLFMTLSVLRLASGRDFSRELESLKSAWETTGLGTVIYGDVADARRIGVLHWSEDPEHFAGRGASVMRSELGNVWETCPEFHMIGRTYSTGYEDDLKFWLLERPVETVCNPNWPWAVWYPLRRKGEFELLEGAEKGSILREHAQIGRSYGAQNYAHDVRLACYGLDSNDNDFVIGLIGEELYPLSHVVQAMRRTRQTAQYIEKMGPFFVGHVLWQYRP